MRLLLKSLFSPAHPLDQINEAFELIHVEKYSLRDPRLIGRIQTSYL